MMSRNKLADKAYSIKYGLEEGVKPDKTYRDFRKKLKKWDSLIIEINRYLAGCINYTELSDELINLIHICDSPQVQYFDKHGAFRLLGAVLDFRLEERIDFEKYCKKLNDAYEPSSREYVSIEDERTQRIPTKFLLDSAQDKRCHPSAKLNFD